MNHYTIKKNEKGGIFLLNEQNQCIKATELISLYPTRRVFAFDAPMGAGKTTFIKQLCEELETEDVVNSPTFAIVNVYDTQKEGEVYHFDCYRLKDIREAQDFGAEEYLYSGNLCLIEWPELIESLLPADTVWVRIKVLDNGDRELSIED